MCYVKMWLHNPPLPLPYRRNELLLSVRPSHSQKGGGDHSKPAAQSQKSKHSTKTLPPSGSATALVPVRQDATPARRQRRESADTPHKMAVVAKEQRHVTKSPAVKKSGRVRKASLSPVVFILDMYQQCNTLCLVTGLLPTLPLSGGGKSYERRP